MAATRKPAAKLQIPFLLGEAVKNGKVILFLGAGASKECRNSKGESPPNGEQLRDILSQKHFGKLMPKRSIMSVAEMAIENGAGKNLVFETVSSAFEGYEVSDAHRTVSDFNWRSIATTNYDLFVEAAYSDAKRRRQTLIPFVKDDEPVDERMRTSLNPLQYLKLHGCLHHRLDKDIPLVLAWEQYASFSQNRTRLFDRLNDLAHECPIIFIGYAMGDSHIRNLVHRLEPKSRPRWYIVDPEAEEEDVNLWTGKNFDVFVCKFGEFMDALDQAVPKLLRFLSKRNNETDFSLRRFYKGETDESDVLRAAFDKDLTHVHSTMPFVNETPERFYSGYDEGWAGIINRFDARRKVTDDLLYKMLLENEHPQEPVLLALRGPAGAGKTIALKRAAFDAATVSSALVLWLEEAGQLRPEVFIEILELTQSTLYLFIDQMALHVSMLQAFVNALKSRRLPLVIVTAEREADWATYCSGIKRSFACLFLASTEFANSRG